MEEKKFNNAIEKSQNLSEDSKEDNKAGAKVRKGDAKPQDGIRRANAKRENSEQGDSRLKEKRLPPREKTREERLAKMQEREEARAEERIKREEERERERQAKKRAKLAKQQAKERKQENLEQLKIKKREERRARRDSLKQERALKKQERLALKEKRRDSSNRERREERIKLKRERAEALRENRALRAEERRQRHKTRASRGIGGWLAAVIVLGCSTLILTTMMVFNVYMSGGGSKMLAGSYSKAFYDLVGYVDNIDVNLSKLAVTKDEQSSQRMLADLMVQSNLAAEDLQALPLHDESRQGTVKFINQLGDFSKYLNNKLIGGESLSQEDRDNLEEFKRINSILKQELHELSTQMGNQFDFSSMLSGQEDNIVFERFNKLESNAVDYPKMIYDGPFADDPQDLNPQKRTGKKIDEAGAIKIVQEIFKDYDLEDLQINGITEGESFNVYNVTSNLEGEQLFAQVSEFGELVTFDCYKVCNQENFSTDQAIDFGYNFLEKCGYKSIKAVWTTQNNGVCYINFAGYKDQIVLYSDLIKLSVCLESGRVYSMDARSYIENSKPRKMPEVKLRVEQAEAKLDSKMQVLTSRLALIPLETGKEKLAYEFFCETAEGEEYYVYIDAQSGLQLEMFKVVLTDEGTLLL